MPELESESECLEVRDLCFGGSLRGEVSWRYIRAPELGEAGEDCIAK